METILMIEDDADIRDAVRVLLKKEGYAVTEAGTGLEGLQKLTDDTDLVLLDVMMPGMSGIQTCREIRKKSNVPILFLTAKVQESDKLTGLTAGGDDYLTKPFSYAELLGRVQALIRRYHVYRGKDEVAAEKQSTLEAHGISVLLDTGEITVRGHHVTLTDMEYRILLTMMRNPDKILSIKEIYERVWKERYFHSSTGTVMVHIRNLRVKIEEDPKNPELIQTVWGKGYRFNNGA